MHTDIERKKQTIAVVGLGLIGASLALALKDTYRIIGCARSRETEAYALSHGIVDEICPVRDMRGADCVIACTPLWVLRQTVQEVYDAVGDTAIITDVGSVKELLKGLPGRLVGGHPMAGTEHSGIEACKRHLFENATYCVVPYENSREKDGAQKAKGGKAGGHDRERAGVGKPYRNRQAAGQERPPDPTADPGRSAGNRDPARRRGAEISNLRHRSAVYFPH